MESLAVVLAVILALLAGFLALLAGLATRRFGERRFLLFGLAFALVASMATLSLVAELDLFDVHWFDEAFALEPVPLFVLLVALALIYGAMASSPRSRGDSGHGGP